jgi:LCP family protein required for cell wall assembly
MRTTIKRGLGRGSAVNGNGRPVLPPGTLSPITIYRQPEPPRRSRWATARVVLLYVFVALLMSSSAVAGGLYLWVHEEVVGAVAVRSLDVKKAAERLDIPVADQPTNALIVGYDARKGPDTGTPPRSDTIMLVRADPVAKSISLLSFPRDLVVDVTCPGKPTYRGRINEAYTECGTRGSLETVRKLTGLPINYLITVNFKSFRQLVDAMGGVWVDVDRRYFNDRGGPGGFATINLHPGYQRLGGYQALDYVRFRHTDSDFSRIARQQLFLKALKAQVRSEFSAVKLPKLVHTVTSNVEVGVGGNKPLTVSTLVSYALFAYGLPPGHFFQSKIDGLEGYAELTTATENIQRAVQEFSHPDVESPEKATVVALGETKKAKAKKKAPPPGDTSITVLNGNGITGSASTASYLLSQRGYSMIFPPDGKPANAPNWDFFETRVAYDPAQPRSKEAARKVATLFATEDVIAQTPKLAALANGAMLTVIVGQTFHGTITAAPVDKTPKRQPPYVTPGAEHSLALLRERAKKLPFPLMVPTVIERNSIIDRERPIRLYRIGPDDKHKTIRLTYRTGASEYWGVQMTDWEDAPVLSERNFVRSIGGRRYELHYTGPKLHMVVLRQGGATYWVVNTVLDALSNETMLAIAKGLKPLSSIK